MCPGLVRAVELHPSPAAARATVPHCARRHDAQGRVARPCRHRRRGRMGRVRGRTGAGLLRRDARRRAARRSATTSCRAPSRATTSRTCGATRSPEPRSKPRCSTRSCARPGESLVVLAPGRHAHDASTAGVAIGITDDEQRAPRRSRPRTSRRGLPPDQAARSNPAPTSRSLPRCAPRSATTITLAVDANGSYALEDVDDARRTRSIRVAVHRAATRTGRDPRDHASWRSGCTTPIALDESVTSATIARDAIALRCVSTSSTSNPDESVESREAKRVHDAVRRRRDVPALIGGMLETGIGRAVNVALARFPGSPRPATCRASNRYFAEDITEPLVLDRRTTARAHRTGHRCVGAHRRDRARTRSRARRCAPGPSSIRAGAGRARSSPRARRDRAAGRSDRRTAARRSTPCTIATSSSRGPSSASATPRRPAASTVPVAVRRNLWMPASGSRVVLVVHHAAPRVIPRSRVPGRDDGRRLERAVDGDRRNDVATRGERQHAPTVGRDRNRPQRTHEPDTERLEVRLLGGPAAQEGSRAGSRRDHAPGPELVGRQHPGRELLEVAPGADHLDVDADRALPAPPRRLRPTPSATG